MKLTVAIISLFLGLSVAQISRRQDPAPLCFAGSKNPKCCTQALGMWLSCTDPTQTPADRAAFRSTCTDISKQAKCCDGVFPGDLGIGLGCVEPFPN
ncbi:fungal hydrophobin [Cladorrhinum sp. PSN332]|nr:fungal hydrophobin [Cladorrhinum sp. PSN332]